MCIEKSYATKLLADCARQYRRSHMRSAENSLSNGQIENLMVPLFAYLVPCFYHSLYIDTVRITL